MKDNGNKDKGGDIIVNEGKGDGISIVVPFLNEADGIVDFCDVVDDYVKKLSFPVEIIFVDDGSTDGTGDKLKEYKFDNVKSAKLITLSKNSGSHIAIRAGLTRTQYDICTWLSSDLQEPLDLLPYAYDKIKKGYNAVYIDRKSVRVSLGTKIFSGIYSRLMRRFAVKNYTSNGISVIVFDKHIKDMLNSHIESNSSIHLQIIDSGYKYDYVSMEFNERNVGKSKWTLSKKIKLFIDSFVAFSFMPIRMVSVIGIIMFLCGMILGIWTIIGRFTHFDMPIGYATMISVMSMGFGITNISLGIIAEYLWRTYDVARNRPVFQISDEAALDTEGER